jgi:predicted house-cleaning noncanonical NTP pyrophosphatase (MazG superfamily)
MSYTIQGRSFLLSQCGIRRLNMPVYNKLVRDLIPQSIEQSNKKFVAYQLSDRDFQNAILDKLIEEALELKDAWSNDPTNDVAILEELGDVFEALDTIMKTLKMNRKQVKFMQEKKAEAKGRFEKRIFLYEVYDE